MSLPTTDAVILVPPSIPLPEIRNRPVRISRAPRILRAAIVDAFCGQCRHRHRYEFEPVHGFRRVLTEWYTKHAGHAEVEFRSPRRSQKIEYQHGGRRGGRIGRFLDNANVKVAYGASASVTITLASLAASSSLLAGREATAIDNGASNKYLDTLTSGYFKSAASNNQAGSILVCAVAARDDTPNWPDVFDGTDSVETVSKQGVFDQVCKIMAAITADNTASQTWVFGLESVAQRFGGWLPDQYAYFVTHNIQTSTNGWSSTESDHDIMETPVYATAV